MKRVPSINVFRTAGGWLRSLLLFLALLMPAGVQAATGDLGSILGAIEDPYPLRAADTSSPRDTLRTYLRDMDAAIEAWLTDRPDAEIQRPLRRAIETFDLSDVAAFERQTTAVLSAALLKEILDRVELPPFDQIPGDADVAEGKITRWVIPNTKIEIVRIGEGSNEGRFLFSKSTVRGLEDYYQLAKNLPYKQGASIKLYDTLISSPGLWLPRNFSQDFPEWANTVVIGQGLWQWISLAIIFLLAGFLSFNVYKLGVRWDKRRKRQHRSVRFGIPAALLLIYGITVLAQALASNLIGILGDALSLVSYAIIAVQVFILAWFVLAVSDRLADAFSGSQDVPPEKRRVDAALMRILFRLLSIIGLVFLGVFAAEYVGIPLAPLVAGLGVGGLAIALAIRPTLENVIGGLTLFADRPVRVGDFCSYGDKIGTVEEIGLRSTRIRSLERTIVTVPNSEFAQMQIDNFAARDLRLLKTILQLRYETTPDQLRYVLAELRRMLLGHPMVTPDPARVRFVGYGAFSLDVEVFAYLRCQDHNVFLAIQEDILLRMADIIRDSGTGFAFPSQTLYVSRDTGVDAARAAKAEEAVEDWRDRGRLPFPNFDPGLRWEMEDILDYPPRGAYGYRPRAGVSESVPKEQVLRSASAGESAAPQAAGPSAQAATQTSRAIDGIRKWLRGSRKYS